MKRTILLLLSACVVGASPTLPRFQETLGQPTDLSSSGVIQARRELASSPLPAAASVAATRSRSISRMPIVKPDESVNRKLRVVAPDASKDYKVMVKTPETDVED